jgi:tetratricopeptide (TPR) repeat protein
MRPSLTVLVAVAVAALVDVGGAGHLRGEDPPPIKPPWQRLLQGEDARKADALHERVFESLEGAQFTRALQAARELSELRERAQGKDHWQAVDARWQVEALRRVVGKDKKSQADYAEVFRLLNEARTLMEQGRFQQAHSLLEKMLTVLRNVLGEDHPLTAAGYNFVASNVQTQGKYREAEEGYRKALDIVRKALGEEHPQTANGYNNVALMHNALGKYAEADAGYRKALDIQRKVLGEEHKDTALSYNNLAGNLDDLGRYREAAESYRKALAIQCRVLGEEHPDTAQTHNNAAFNLQMQGKYKEAEESFRKALAIRRKVLGEDHPLTAQSYNNVAFNLTAQGRCKEAEKDYRTALAIRRKLFGEVHPEIAETCNNMGINLAEQGNYAAAEECFRKALDIQRKVFGEEHPLTATCYLGVAANLHKQGRYREAEEGFRRALDIFRKVQGEEHPSTATGYSNVAACLQAQGRYHEAEGPLQKALTIRRKALGEEHPDTAVSLSNAAANIQAQGRHPEAEEDYRKTLDIVRKSFGENHPYTARAYSNIAASLDAQGRYPEAEEYHRKGLEICRKVLDKEHPDTAASYNSLAANLNARGKYKEAEEFLVRGGDTFLAARVHFAVAGLERAARAGEDSPLARLAALLARNGKSAAAWQRYEQGLGRGLWDDLSTRRSRQPEEHARQMQICTRLQRLDLLLQQTPAEAKPTAEQRAQREELLSQRLKAQQEWSDFHRKLEEKYGAVAGQIFPRENIQAALPADTALVGWIDQAPAGPKAADPNGEHWAFLLRAKGDPVCVRLSGSGDGGAWSENDTALPADLRTAVLERRGSWRRLAERLAEQRLGPLSKHLAAHDSLPAVKHLIVLPSPLLAGVPVELLAEKHTVSYAHSGTLFAHLRSLPHVQSQGLFALADPVFQAASAASKEKSLPPAGVLLTVVQPGSNAAKSRLRPGDVLLTYNDKPLSSSADLAALIAAAAGDKAIPVTVWREDNDRPLDREVSPGKLGIVLADKPAPEAIKERRRLDRRLASRGNDDWRELPGTRAEVTSITHLFGGAPVRVLTDSQASEQKLYELEQSGELKKYRYVHLATHGEVDDRFPLRSAVILSRDDLPDPGKQLLEGKPVFDGRLTAEEVLQQWNLDCDLVTLSACQTALGKYERGEGFVGFAQALTLCGSRSVCLSLWQVDDAATALLMQRFYANLLGKRDGLKAPMPKAQALREAKEWLRNLSREEALREAAEVSNGVERGKGRPKGKLLPALPEREPSAKDDKPYAHPYYWAAFVLIGDPD